jgi:hypothetical protein
MSKLLNIIRHQQRQTAGTAITVCYSRGRCSGAGGGRCAVRREDNLPHSHIGNRLMVLAGGTKFETFTRNVLAAAQEAGEKFVVIHRAPDEFGLLTVQRFTSDLRTCRKLYRAGVEPKPGNISL